MNGKVKNVAYDQMIKPSDDKKNIFFLLSWKGNKNKVFYMKGKLTTVKHTSSGEIVKISVSFVWMPFQFGLNGAEGLLTILSM